MKDNNNITIYDQNWTEWLDLQLYGPKHRWLRHILFECLKQLDDEGIHSILDVGCGEGTITYFTAKHFTDARVAGIDISQVGISCAQQRWNEPNLHFFHDETLKRLKDNYDLICCFEVLEHVQDWQGLLDRFSASALKYIALSFPVGKMRPFETSVGHLRNFQEGEVESYLSQKGFLPENIFYAGYPFYSPIYRELCNAFNVPGSNFARGKYGVPQRIVSQFFYLLFRFCSTKKRFGEQFCGVFRKDSSR